MRKEEEREGSSRRRKKVEKSRSVRKKTKIDVKKKKPPIKVKKRKLFPSARVAPEIEHFDNQKRMDHDKKLSGEQLNGDKFSQGDAA